MKKCRADRNMSIYQSAKYLGVNMRTLIHMEEDLKIPEDYRMGAICELYDIKPSDIDEPEDTVINEIGCVEEEVAPPVIELIKEVTETVVKESNEEEVYEESFGEILRRVREEKGMSGIAASKELKIGISTLHDYETNKSAPNNINLGKMCKYYGLDFKTMKAMLTVEREVEIVDDGTVGTLLKIERTKRNLTQAEVAEAVGMHKSTLGKYELNKSIPNKEILDKLGVFYGITIERTLIK